LRRTTVGLVVVVFAVFLWAIFPAFTETSDYVLVLSVNPGIYSECSTGSACFTLELRNRGPWPITIRMIELQFYPSLIGPSISVNWLGPGPDKLVQLMPFTGHTYTFRINIMSGLGPPDKVYAIMTANIAMSYASHYVVLHSGKR